MHNALEVKKDIFWVGALDFDIRIFDIIMYTEYGTTYNSYIVKGTEKTVLFELVKLTFFDEFITRVKKVIEPSKIDYIVVSHTEPDHSGSLEKLLDLCPNVKIIGTKSAIRFLKNIVNRSFEYIEVKDNDTIDIGNKTLKFIIAPFLHWPDSMYTYIEESKTIFTCDSFGCHYCDEKVFNDSIDGDFYDAYKYYFDCIFGPFKTHVLNAIEKIKDLNIETICNGHGPVIRKNPTEYIEMYKEWAKSSKRETPSVVIAYVTSYGYTKKIAEQIALGLKSVGKIDLFIYDLVKFSTKDAMKEINDASGILIGSPTLVGDTLPPIWHLLAELNPIVHNGMYAGAFGSYGWSGEAVPNIEERLKQLKFKIPNPGLKVCFNPSNDDLKNAYEFGKTFGEEILKNSK